MRHKELLIDLLQDIIEEANGFGYVEFDFSKADMKPYEEILEDLKNENN